MPSITGEEVWKPLYRFEPLYEVSSYGQVRALVDIVYQNGSRFGAKGTIAHYKGDFIKPIDGVYLSVTLYDPRMNARKRSNDMYIHELVSTTFQAHDDGLVVDHIDGNKHNNHLCNLQRISQRENNIKSYKNDESNRWTNRKCSVIRSDGVEYKNLQEAIHANNIKNNAVLINAIKRATKCNGYYWRYLDADKQKSIDAIIEKRSINIGNRSAWVKCIEHDKMYIHSDLQRMLNVADGVIYDAITCHEGYSAYLDLHFELIPDSEIDYFSEYVQNYIKQSRFYQSKRIMCVQTGIVYPTMKFASKTLNISTDYIKRSIREGFTGRCGLTFVKI